MAIYYVDATSGDDAKDGLSTGNAWKTIAKVNASSFAPGDSILFKRGETWREQLIPPSGAAGLRITFGAYGSGAKPLLLGSVEKNDAVDWADQGSNIWESVATFPVDVGNLIFNAEASVGVKVWEAGDLDAQGKFFFDEATSKVKIYSVGNPATFYSDIECALTRLIVKQSDHSDLVFENLDLRYGGSHGFGGDSTKRITIRDCDLSYIGGGDQYGGASTVRYGNGIEFYGAAEGHLVERCRISQIYDAAVTNQGASQCLQQNIIYRNNVISKCHYSFEYWNGPASSKTDGIHFENNTCLNAGGGWGESQRPDVTNSAHLKFFANSAQTTRFYVRNNVFYESAYQAISMSSTWPDLANLTLENNCYFESAGNVAYWQGVDYAFGDFALYQSETGKDGNSVAADPSFVNPASDYHLLSGSPAIDAGTVVDHDTDFEKQYVPKGMGFDIGAHEYAPTVHHYVPKPRQPMRTHHRLNRGLVGIWPAHEGAGTAVHDFGPHREHGAFNTVNSQDPEWIASAWGWSLRFPDGGQVAIPHRVEQRNAPLTIVTAFRFDQLPSTGHDYTVCEKQHGAAPDLAWRLYVNDTDDKITFLAIQADTSVVLTVADAVVAAGRWYTAAVVVRKDNTTGLWIDGVEQADSDTVVGGLYPATGAMAIGAGDVSKTAKGEVAALRLHGRALTHSEITELHRDLFAGLRRERALVEV